MRQALLKTFLAMAGGISCGALTLWSGASPWLAVAMAAIVPATMLIVVSVRQPAALAELSEALRVERERHRATREFVQRILDVIPMPVYIKDADSRNLFVNKALADEWGRPAEQLIGRLSFDLSDDPELAERIKVEDASVIAGGSIYREEQRRHDVTGAEQFRVVTKQRCFDTEGRPLIVCAFFDTTAWRRAENALKDALAESNASRIRTEDFIQRLVDVIPDPFFIKDAEGRLLLINQALVNEHDKPREELVGRNTHELALFSTLDADTIRRDQELSRKEDEAVIAGAAVDKEQHVVLPSGEERFRHVIKRRCIYVDGSPAIVVAHFNITPWRLAERQLERIAHEDVLTGLPNRRRFMDECARMMTRADRHCEPLSIVLFDLDRFKQVNDEFGHLCGDGVLREVARRVESCLRGDDLPCRWGGEEFAVLLPLTADAEAMQVADRLRLNIGESPIRVGDCRLDVTISCGVARWQKGESAERLLGRADKAMYAAKNAGRNTCALAPPAS